jgi:hypothetical protein
MNSPDVIGADLAPMPTEDDRKGAWRRLYIARMVSRGVDVEDALANFEAVGFSGFTSTGFGRKRMRPVRRRSVSRSKIAAARRCSRTSSASRAPSSAAAMSTGITIRPRSHGWCSCAAKPCGPSIVSVGKNVAELSLWDFPAHARTADLRGLLARSHPRN